MNAAIDNRMRQIAELVLNQQAMPRLCIVTSYDPDAYAVKVQVMPDGGDTSGWLPLGALQAGNGFGIFAPPNLGDQVLVLFEQGSLQAGHVVAVLYSDEDRPVSVPAGEVLIRHRSGSLLHFHDDGDVSLHAAGAINSQATQWNHTGPVNIVGPLHATGNLTSDADVLDQGGGKSMAAMRAAHNGHSHPPDTDDLPDLEM